MAASLGPRFRGGRAVTRRRLLEDYQHATDAERLRANALKQAEELEELFRKDAEQKRAAAE